MASTNALQARRIPTKRPAGVPCPEQTGQRSPYRPSLITHCSTRHKRSWPAMRKPADAIANMTISLWVDDCGAVSVVVACLATSTCTGIAGTGVPSNRIKTGGRRTEEEQRRLEQTVDVPSSRLPHSLPHMPGSAISCHENLCCLGSPRTSRVERQVSGPLRFPVLAHGVDKRPGLVDPIRARKERLIALHGLVEQPFVGTRRVRNAKGQIIAKMHGHRTHADVWSRLFGQKGVHNALVGLEAKRQNIMVPLSAVLDRKHQMRSGLEMDANFRALARQPFARAQVKRHTRPAPIIQRQFERRKGGRGGVRRHVLLVTVGPYLVAVEFPSTILPK